jgi:hypothetical protein
LIAAIKSSHVFTSVSRSVLPLMSVLEQMLAEHPTPSSLATRPLPSAMVILAASPDKWPCLASDGSRAPTRTTKAAGESSAIAEQMIRSHVAFIFWFLHFLASKNCDGGLRMRYW